VNVFVVLEKPHVRDFKDIFSAPPCLVYGVYADETDAAKAAGQSADRWYVSSPFTPGVIVDPTA
jgi:hypothetical protein